MNKKESQFDFWDLLQNDRFVKSVLYPDGESEQYWQRKIEKGIVDREVLQQAKIFLLKFCEQNKPDLSEDRTVVLWNRINKTNKRKKRYRLVLRFAAAACLIVAISIGVYNVLNISETESTIFANLDLKSIAQSKLPNDIELQLSNEKILLQGKDATIDHNSVGGIKINEKLVQRGSSALDVESKFNKLLVPYGKQSILTLEDGSRIWVNAGTRLIYPEKFAKDKREIFVSGEIFCDIVHEPERPFILRTSMLEVKVLGTRLNISAYPDEQEQSVILVNGSVYIKPVIGISTKMKPNQLYVYSYEQDVLSSVDAERMTSWIKGFYSFKHEDLGKVLQRLSRFYGIPIECSQSVFGLKCSGSLDLKDDPSRVLKGLSESMPVRCLYSANGYSFIKDVGRIEK